MSLMENKAGKNLHLEHIEDEILNFGVPGGRAAINFMRSLRDMFSGESRSSVNMTVKWDGAPAIFAGVEPETGDFFVAKKSVFNATPKLYKTEAEIDADLSGNLNSKFKVALKEFSKLGIKGVLQGDLMFTDDVETTKIDGTNYYTFQPNTIVYAVPTDSELGKVINKAKVGIVWHTTYTGSALQDMKASFGYDSSKLKSSSKVWFTDARIKDVSGQVQLKQENVAKIKQAIKELSSMKIDADTFKAINQKIGSIDLVQAIKAHANLPIRSGQALESDVTKFVKEFLQGLNNKLDKEISGLATGPEGKAGQARLQTKDALANIINTYETQIAEMYRAYLKVEAVKMMFQQKMKNIKAIDSFIEQPDGSFKVTDPEGFVIVDHVGRAMKIVDRLEFSAANFAPRD